MWLNAISVGEVTVLGTIKHGCYFVSDRVLPPPRSRHKVY